MTNDPSQAAIAEWDAWVASRPENVRAVAERFKPWLEYQFEETKRVCFLYSFDAHEDGTVTLKVVAPQIIGDDHLVFGVDPNRLELRDETCVDPRELFKDK